MEEMKEIRLTKTDINILKTIETLNERKEKIISLNNTINEDKIIQNMDKYTKYYIYKKIEKLIQNGILIKDEESNIKLSKELNSLIDKYALTKTEKIVLDIIQKEGCYNERKGTYKKEIIHKLARKKIIYKINDKYYITEEYKEKYLKKTMENEIKIESKKLMEKYNLRLSDIKIINILKQRSNKHKIYEGYIRVRPLIITQIYKEINLKTSIIRKRLEKLIDIDFVVRVGKSHYFLTEKYRQIHKELYPEDEINIIEIPKDIEF